MLTKRLVDRGVSKSAAASLIKDFSAAQIEEKLAIFDWLTSRRDRRVSANAPGFLVAAIRNDYAAPKDFRKSNSAKSPTRRVASTTVGPVPSSPADDAVEGYLATLNAEQRVELELRAVAAADPLTAEGYWRTKDAGGPTFAAYRHMVIEKHVRTLLR